MSARTERRIGRISIYGDRKRSKGQPMGRFGGGWQYKVGITAGGWSEKRGRTILLALWTVEYRIKVHPKGGAA